jgi:hypothetical protein
MTARHLLTEISLMKWTTIRHDGAFSTPGVGWLKFRVPLPARNVPWTVGSCRLIQRRCGTLGASCGGLQARVPAYSRFARNADSLRPGPGRRASHP